MAATARALLPFDTWASGTNQNSIPANDNTMRAEVIARSAVSFEAAQPGSPADPGLYVLSAAWGDEVTGTLAYYKDSAWSYWVPYSGLIKRVGAGDYYAYDVSGSGTWDAFSSGGTAGIPQNSKSADYTLVLSDANKHVLHPSADTTARTFTIPANASVAFPIGTAVTFVNQNAAGIITIAITSDTMRLAGPGTTGSRTLAANGIATALKITPTAWIISGTGLT